MSTARLIIVLIGLLFAVGVQASPSTDTLAKCLLDNTTGKDRKDLAKWIFVAMSAHPEIGVIAKASPADAEAVQRTMGTLFTRLLAEQCAEPMRAVLRADGSNGVRVAFEYLGSMAMQELMTNQEVVASIGGFERFADRVKIDSALKLD